METKALDHGGNVSRSPHSSPENLPTGTVTFLYTDIEGSTKLWQAHQSSMPLVVAQHDGVLRGAVEAHRGVVFRTGGDAIYASFATPLDALAAAVAGQRALLEEQWEDSIELRVRMALHTGAVEVRDGDYVGHTLNRMARLLSAAHGQQILLSDVTQQLVCDQLPPDVELRDLGEHHLRDLRRPEHIFQVVAPGLPSNFPHLVTKEVVPTNLPQEQTAFVGRQQDIRAVVDILQRNDGQMVTLTGPGGTGKTRLSIRVGAAFREHARDGVFFVPLAPVPDSSLVASAIAATLGLQEVAGQPWEETLQRYLRHKEMLLVLDNFEHVLDAALLVADLLANPELKVLVTSRSVLHLSAEHEYAVPPLKVPDPRHLPELEELSQYDAVALFIQRAQAVKADFAVTNENAPAVAEICHRLDGLPLAIELAAARVRLFPPQALLSRLQNRLKLLTGGARDLPTRQQTLRGAIDWSYSLLDVGEQQLFARLSVFAGGFTLEAAETVCNPHGDLDVLDTVQSLVEKSLLRHEGEDEPRFGMLETIKEYAAERLEDLPEASTAMHRAHAIYFADLARRQWERLSGDRRDSILAAIAADIENLRLAWKYWVDERDLDRLNGLVDSLWLLYDTRGWYRATIELTTELLDVLSSAPPTPERAMQELTLRTSQARALMAIHGYTQEVEDAYARALEAFGEQRELPQLFPVLRGLASFYTYRAEFEKGAQVGRAILRMAEAQDAPSIRVDGHLVLGSSLGFQYDLHGSLEHLNQAIADFEARGLGSRRFGLGTNPGVASLTVSALILWLLGFPDQALERANRAIDLASGLEHPFTLAYALFHSGFLHLWRREPELVHDRALTVVDVANERDLQIWKAVGTVLLGAAKTELDRAEEGLADIRDGIGLYQGLTTPPVFWPLLLVLRAGAYARAGKPLEGLSLIEEALELAGSEITLIPEFYLLKGDLLLLHADRNSSEAEAWFLRAFERARELDARMPQLRAAIRLYRAQREWSHAEQASRLLSSVYGTFTEGFTTPDLVDAGNLLKA